MRLALALVALACAGSAAAEPVQDRYGPPRKAAVSQARPYDGRMLGWAGKAAAMAPQAAAPPRVSAAQPPALPPAPRLAALAPAPAPQAPAAAPLPQNLYDAPPPPAPPPRLAQAEIAPPPAQRGAAPSRLYSLHREYGMTPDVAPAAPSRTHYVLIGPSDAPAGPQDTPGRAPPADASLF